MDIVPDEGTPKRSACLCGCGTPLTGAQVAWSSNACKLRARRRTPQARTLSRSRQASARRVGGVDGESVGKGSHHRYVLLVAATDDGEVHRVENPQGLSTSECLDFLTSLPKGITWWGFSFKYDVNMILKDVPPHLVERLQIEGRTFWGRYYVEYVGHKLLVSKRKGSGKHRKTVGSFTLWDMFPWVQTSFAKWLRKWELAPERTIQHVERYKNLRADFKPSQRAGIRKYCITECQLLASGARRLMELLDATGLHCRGFHSPASAAKAAMVSHDVLDYRGDDLIPETLRKPIDAAYFGGRAELSEVGPVEGPVYAYDLNSAYPAAAIGLPCLAHGRWVQGRGAWELVKVRWRCGTGVKWGPFPKRPQVGSLRYPTSGTGWYWGQEVTAAQRHPRFNITVLDSWTWVPECDHQPFAYLREYYDLRRKLKESGDMAEIVYKLVLNSTYGALAEHLHYDGKEVRTPKHRCMVWAGLITSITRAKLLDVMSDDVIHYATDCAMSRSPLQVPTGGDLGDWGHDPAADVFDKMFVFGTGQYFKMVGGEWKVGEVKSRGFNPNDVPLEALQAVWKAEGREGQFRFTRDRFVGYGTALRRIGGMWPPLKRSWRTWVKEPVVKRFDMSPRRSWASEDVWDGRTLAPSLSEHRKLERQDLETIERLSREYMEAYERYEKAATKPNPKGDTSPFVGVLERRAWTAALRLSSFTGQDDEGHVFDRECEPVAWGDDF